MINKSKDLNLKPVCDKMGVQYLLIFSLFTFNTTAYAETSIVLNSSVDAPFTTITHDGFLDKVATEVFNNIGINLLVDLLPAERGLRNANNGIIDGDISRIKGLEKLYPNLIRVPENIYTMSFVVFSKKTIDLRQGWDALSKKDIAFITGWKIFEKNAPDTALVTMVNNSEQLFTLLKRDRTDYVLYSRWGGLFMIKQLNLNGIQLQLPPLAKMEMFIYLHKRHSKLVPRLSQALLDLKTNGRYDSLVKKYLTSMQDDR